MEYIDSLSPRCSRNSKKLLGDEPMTFRFLFVSKANVWVRQKIGVPEANGLLEQLNKWKLAEIWAWKRRSEGLVMAVTQGEMGILPGRRRTVWIDY